MNAINQHRPETRSPLTVFLALASLLLISALAVGCSEQSSSALSPVDYSNSTDVSTLTDSEQNQFDAPMLAKSTGASDATFRVTLFGDITGGPGSRTHRLNPSSTHVNLNTGIDLNLTYFQTAIAGGDICFSAGSYIGPMTVDAESKKNPSVAQCRFWFRATGSDGVTEIKYMLTMNGTFTDPNNWPPAVGTQTTAIIIDWEMQTESAGKDRNVSCTGEGMFDSGVTILVERIS